MSQETGYSLKDLGEVLVVLISFIHVTAFHELTAHDDPTIFRLVFLDTLMLILAIVIYVVVILPWKLARDIFDGVNSPQSSSNLQGESIRTAQAPRNRTNCTGTLRLPDTPWTAYLTDPVTLSLIRITPHPVQGTEQPETAMVPSHSSVRRCVTQIACNEPYTKNVTDFPPRLESHNHDFNTCNDCFQEYLEFETSNTHWSRILCPELDCGVPLRYHDVQRLVSPALFEIYDQATLRDAMNSD